MLPCGCVPGVEDGYGDDGTHTRDTMEWCDMHATAQRQARYINVKAAEDGLWVHLHGLTTEGAVNLSESVHGPLTKQAIEEVWRILQRVSRSRCVTEDSGARAAYRELEDTLRDDLGR